MNTVKGKSPILFGDTTFHDEALTTLRDMPRPVDDLLGSLGINMAQGFDEEDEQLQWVLKESLTIAHYQEGGAGSNSHSDQQEDDSK